MGRSFDRKLWTAIGRTIGTEARGLANQGKCTLYFLDPNINLMRDPRWGRAPWARRRAGMSTRISSTRALVAQIMRGLTRTLGVSTLGSYESVAVHARNFHLGNCSAALAAGFLCDEQITQQMRVQRRGSGHIEAAAAQRRL